jgi:hypothetical protein
MEMTGKTGMTIKIAVVAKEKIVVVGDIGIIVVTAETAAVTSTTYLVHGTACKVRGSDRYAKILPKLNTSQPVVLFHRFSFSHCIVKYLFAVLSECLTLG